MIADSSTAPTTLKVKHQLEPHCDQLKPLVTATLGTNLANNCELHPPFTNMDGTTGLLYSCEEL